MIVIKYSPLRLVMQLSIAALVLTALIACGNTDKAKDGNTDHSAHQGASSGSSYCDSVNTGLINADTLKGSPHRVAMNTIGNTHVHIEYNSPGVKDRVIWGGLVAYDKVWVTGAHKATTIKLDNPAMFGDKKIPAGKYAIFTIPGKESWTFILNTRYDQHLADEYSEQEDMLRMSVTPVASEMVQRLTYAVTSSGENKGAIEISWEKLKLTVPFTAE
ncbi:MAG TPA: DUF2911 domain-containing protein [Chitinophagaceae bacterium]|nr:DUF2911 domain-containing protein [Chitinophagaceae bacterium]